MGSTNDKHNLLIVSNRLPLSVKRIDGAFQSSLSSGGLVTALSGLTKSTQFRWFGWPGIEVKDAKDQEAVAQSLAEHSASPIFLDSDLAHEHYNSFSSKSPDLLAARDPYHSRYQTESSGPSSTTNQASYLTMVHGKPTKESTNCLQTPLSRQPTPAP